MLDAIELDDPVRLDDPVLDVQLEVVRALHDPPADQRLIGRLLGQDRLGCEQFQAEQDEHERQAHPVAARYPPGDSIFVFQPGFRPQRGFSSIDTSRHVPSLPRNSQPGCGFSQVSTIASFHESICPIFKSQDYNACPSQRQGPQVLHECRLVARSWVHDDELTQRIAPVSVDCACSCKIDAIRTID